MRDALEIAGYTRNNVLPAIRRRTMRATRHPYTTPSVLYSAEAVDPLQASGGFNTVIEFNSSTCRQQVASAITSMQPLDCPLDDEMRQDLETAASPGATLAHVLRSAGSIAPEEYRGFRLRLALGTVTFADENTVVVGFIVTLSFVYQTVALPGTPELVPLEGWDPTTSELSNAAASNEAWGAAGVNPGEVVVERQMMMRATPTSVAPSERHAIHSLATGPSLPPESEIGTVVIGSFGAELRAPLTHRDEPDRACTRVFADLRRANWSESLPPQPARGQPPDDVLLVHDSCFEDWLSGAGSMLQAPLDLPLTPTVSLVGANQSGAPVSEVADFEVRAFAVFDASGFDPALAVAFDVAPGCHGIVEDVSHFIGPNPYGVITDEFVIDCVCHHQWNIGGFDRSLGLHANVQMNVTRNGQQRLEDAVISGRLELLTLEYAQVTTDANTRSDCVAFGGQGRIVPVSARLLADGQTFSANQVDLGAPSAWPWQVNASIAAGAGAVITDPEFAQFQAAAQRDVTRPIAAPFAFTDASTPILISYARIEGVTRHVFILGQLPGVLR